MLNLLVKLWEEFHGLLCEGNCMQAWFLIQVMVLILQCIRMEPINEKYSQDESDWRPWNSGLLLSVIEWTLRQTWRHDIRWCLPCARRWTLLQSYWFYCCKTSVEKYILRWTFDYPCLDYPVCRLSVHDHKLLMTNDERGKYRDLVQSDRRNAQYTNRYLSCVFMCVFLHVGLRIKCVINKVV
jgi:hypothetical protein